MDTLPFDSEPAPGRRVIFVNRVFFPDPSATSQILTDLVEACAEAGLNPHVITGRSPAGEEDLPNVRIERVGRGKPTGAGLVDKLRAYMSFFVHVLRALARTLKPGDLVVVMTDPPLLSVPVSFLARRRGAHVIPWLQDLYPEVAQRLAVPLVKGPIGALLVALRNRSLRHAKKIVVIGERMRAFVESQGIAPETIHVIPNWADDIEIRPVPRDINPLRHSLGLADRFVVGYSGNLGRAHEYDTFLAAADRLRDRADLAFVFFGSGFYYERLRQEVQDRGLSNRFLFLPLQPRSELSQSLSLPDVHWVSLRPELEGLIVPSKIYGLAAAGRPVLAIADPDGEVGRLVKQYHFGFCIAPGRSEEVADRILRMLEDRELCFRMGQKARTMIENGASKQDRLRAWVHCLQSVHDTVRPV